MGRLGCIPIEVVDKPLLDAELLDHLLHHVTEVHVEVCKLGDSAAVSLTQSNRCLETGLLCEILGVLTFDSDHEFVHFSDLLPELIHRGLLL